MAARFAVATGNWTGAIWAATAGGAAGSAAAPTIADAATINGGVTVTLDTIGLVAQSLTVTGSIVASTVASSDLTVANLITVQSGATFDVDVSGNAAIAHTLYLNQAGTADFLAFNGNVQSNKISFKGFPKTRHTRLNGGIAIGATSATLNDVTGWQIGDVVAFGSTSTVEAASAWRESTEVKTITGIVGNTISWVGGTTYGYLDTGYVGNMSSNCVIRSYTMTQAAGANMELNIQQEAATKIKLFSNVQFTGLHGFFSGGVKLKSAFWQSDSFQGFLDCAFYDNIGSAVGILAGNITCPIERCVWWTSKTHSTASWDNHIGVSGSIKNSRIKDNLFLRNSYTALASWNAGSSGTLYVEFEGNVVCGCRYSIADTPQARHIRSTWSCGSQGSTIPNIGYAEGCLFKREFGDTSNVWLYPNSMATILLKDCTFGPGTFLSEFWVSSLAVIGPPPAATITIQNRNTDVLVQEIWTPQSYTVPTFKRDNAVFKRSTSSILVQPKQLSQPTKRELSLPVANGATLRVIGYCRFDTNFNNGGNRTAPTVTLSGLGATPAIYTATAAANEAWEKFDLSLTNTSGADGAFTLTYEVVALAVTTGKVYFDGVPDAPFITKCRHYGFLFDESSPVRTVNQTISAPEATAAAYLGMTVTWGAASSTVSITADNTFQKLYDYTQAQGCLNIPSAMPITGAGVAGSPVLFAQGDVTITAGNKLNGAGSLSMGGYTLTTEFSGSSAYTYTGGSWSQATSIPAFGGGVLGIGAAGTYEFDTTGTVIVNMSPTGASTYSMPNVTANGVLDLRNTTAHAISVELSTETAALAITSNNTGGIITIIAPQVRQSVTVNGLTPGSRVQIYDLTSGTELHNAIAAGTIANWTDPAVAVATRAIRVRIAYVSGVTAKEFVEANIGTCGLTEPANAISYLASQVDDDVYVTNALDGSLVTGITIDDSVDRVKINVAAGSVTWPQIYAYQVYWLGTAAGIVDDGAFIEAVDPANYILTGFDIRNTHASPLTVTGGWGRDSVTLTVAGCIDAAGSTGNIYAAPDHVVPYSVGSGLTAGQAAALSAIETSTSQLSSTTPGTVDVNITYVNGVAVAGTGAENDPWGPV